MPNWKIKTLVWVLVAIFYSGLLQAQVPLTLQESTTEVSLNGQALYYYKDAKAGLNFNQILTQEFKPVNRNRNNFGASSSVFWFRFRLKNVHQFQKDWRLEIDHPLLDHIHFYYQENKTWKKIEMGDLLPFKQRPIYSRNFVVPLSIT